jgi:hypothetical protein
MATEHTCDKTLLVEQHSHEITNMVEAHNILDRRVTEMETEMHGHTRNGGGFVGETKESLSSVQGVLTSLDNRMRGVEDAVRSLVSRQGSFRELMKTVLPPIIVGAVTVATVLLSRGVAN